MCIVSALQVIAQRTMQLRCSAGLIQLGALLGELVREPAEALVLGFLVLAQGLELGVDVDHVFQETGALGLLLLGVCHTLFLYQVVLLVQSLDIGCLFFLTLGAQVLEPLNFPLEALVSLLDFLLELAELELHVHDDLPLVLGLVVLLGLAHHEVFLDVFDQDGGLGAREAGFLPVRLLGSEQLLLGSQALGGFVARGRLLLADLQLVLDRAVAHGRLLVFSYRNMKYCSLQILEISMGIFILAIISSLIRATCANMLPLPSSSSSCSVIS